MGAREHQEDDDGADFTREGVAANNTGSSAALPSAFVVALAFAAGISGLLFGCENWHDAGSTMRED